MKERVHPRLKDYDYSLPGAYFVTICTYKRRNLFGETPVGRGLCAPPFPAKEIAERWIREIDNKFPCCKVDNAVVMPNHVHLLLTLAGEAGHAGPTLQSGRASIPEIIRWYKTMTVNDWIRAVKKGVLPPFERTIWQTSFYDHVVRNQRDYETIWQYIEENPLKWTEDIYFEENTP